MRFLFLTLCSLALSTFAQETQDLVIPLKVATGGRSISRDPRVFSAPLKCNGIEGQFIWACGGWTVVTESFAKKCEMQIRPDPETRDLTDAAGEQMFLGQARADIRFGARQHLIDVKVQRDAPENAGTDGTIGYDIAGQFQWQLDPSKPELTLRPLGAAAPQKVIASLPLIEDRENLWVTLKVKGQSAQLMLMPQSTDTQITADLQRQWEITPEKPAPPGAVIPHVIRGDRALELAEDLRESNLVLMLLPDVPNAQAGLGASLLNRFVYCVDAKRRELILISRVPAPGAPAGRAAPR